MNIKQIAMLTLALALVAVVGMGTLTALAQENSEAMLPAKADGAQIGAALNEGNSTFVGIDAVAAAVLDVTEQELVDVGHEAALYQMLEQAGKLDAFKEAVIAAKQAQYAAKAESGKGSLSTDMEERLKGYIETINTWDGTTELVVTSSHSTAKK